MSAATHRGFSYVPLLLPVQVNRKPRVAKVKKAKHQATPRVVVQQPLPLSVGEPDVEYVLKPRPLSRPQP